MNGTVQYVVVWTNCGSSKSLRHSAASYSVNLCWLNAEAMLDILLPWCQNCSMRSAFHVSREFAWMRSAWYSTYAQNLRQSMASGLNSSMDASIILAASVQICCNNINVSTIQRLPLFKTHFRISTPSSRQRCRSNDVSIETFWRRFHLQQQRIRWKLFDWRRYSILIG